MSHNLPDLQNGLNLQGLELLEVLVLQRQLDLEVIYLLLKPPVFRLQSLRVLLLELLQLLYYVSDFAVAKKLRGLLDNRLHYCVPVGGSVQLLLQSHERVVVQVQSGHFRSPNWRLSP